MSARPIWRRLGQKWFLYRTFRLACPSTEHFKNIIPYITREVEDYLARLIAASRHGNKELALELRRDLLAQCPRHADASPRLNSNACFAQSLTILAQVYSCQVMWQV